MAKITEHSFKVSGRGTFPIDMLRHDRCHPAHERDAGLIEATFRPGSRGTPREVEIVGPRAPTEGRWSSFGWDVHDHSSRKVDAA